MSAAEQDPYKILGVSPSASQDEIKNAYRGLAKKFHPDLNPGNKQAEKNFKEINSAYELIGTPEARTQYERLKTEKEQAEVWNRARQTREGPFYYETQYGPEGGRYSGGMDFDSDLFENLFRGGGRHGPRQDPVYELAIEPHDAILGRQLEFTLPTGKTLSVKIPAGIASGAKLRFAKQAGDRDVFVQIRIKSSTDFRVEGTDLYHPLSVDVLDAILGSEVRAPTPEGNVLVRIPRRVNSGAKIRLTGRGLFEKTGGPRGDLIYVVELKFPEAISPELEAAARHQKEQLERRAS